MTSSTIILETTVNILRAKDLAKKLGIAVSTLYDWLNPQSPRYDQQFPKPIKLGARAKGWLSSDINQWLANKLSVTDKVQP